jgi:oxygen-independent coproporphyrinogen-3 oxidase
VSLEANPEDVTPQAASDWRDAGFNRISLGVQSLDAAVLAALGRGHDPAAARAALGTAREAFPSVNADLIFGTPGDGGWAESVAGVLEAGIDHLSVYALTVERGTALSRAVAAGAPAPDPDVQADAYLLAQAAAEVAGLVRYETSNYARPGHACVYNLITWAQGEYAASAMVPTATGAGSVRNVRGSIATRAGPGRGEPRLGCGAPHRMGPRGGAPAPGLASRRRGAPRHRRVGPAGLAPR